MKLYYNDNYSFFVDDQNFDNLKISSISSKGIKYLVTNMYENPIYQWYEKHQSIEDYLNHLYSIINIDFLIKIEFNDFKELENILPEEFI